MVVSFDRVPPLDTPTLAGDRLLEAIGCGGLAWVRTASGELKIVDRLGRAAPIASSFVLDVHRSARGELLLLRGWSRIGGLSSVSVARHDGTTFVDLPSIILNEEAPLAIVDDQGTPVVVTDKRLYTLQQTWSPRELHPPLRTDAAMGRVSAAVPTRGRTVYLGLNRGEFGGGLRAIDVDSGLATPIGESVSAANGATRWELIEDTVTAIVTDPSEQDCVVVSAGLEHLAGSRGRVSKVCGTSLRTVLQREVGPWTVPFYGVVADDSGFWAVSPQAIFRIGLPGPGEDPLRLQPNSNGVYRVSPDVMVMCHGPRGCERPLIANLR